MELLKQLIPELRSVGVLSNSSNPRPMIDHVEAAARSLGMSVLLLDARDPDEFDSAFAAMRTDARADAVIE